MRSDRSHCQDQLPRIQDHLSPNLQFCRRHHRDGGIGRSAPLRHCRGRQCHSTVRPHHIPSDTAAEKCRPERHRPAAVHGYTTDPHQCGQQQSDRQFRHRSSTLYQWHGGLIGGPRRLAHRRCAQCRVPGIPDRPAISRRTEGDQLHRPGICLRRLH